jgi:segregation and condensation protein A
LERPSAFALNLDNFEGPFDLLLSLISKHELAITEVSLSQVTDEFIAYLKQLDGIDEMDQASEFLVVAATLLDLKIVSLLPKGELVDAEDVAALEARDLLFARLLQYRAFKDVSSWFAGGFESEVNRVSREVPLEERFLTQQKKLVWATTLEQFTVLAMQALAPKPVPTVGLTHLHAPQVSIREQAKLVFDQLVTRGRGAFTELLGPLADRPVVVARFLALLELYRLTAIGFEFDSATGAITVTLKSKNFDTKKLASLGAEFDA